MADLAAFLTSIVINVVIFLICLHLFSFLRTRLPIVYAPRLDSKKRKNRPEPPSCASGFYNWIPSIYRITNDEIYETAGMDAVMFCRFFGVCIKLFFVSSLPGMIILWPINATGGVINVHDFYTNSSQIGDFEILTMANIPARDHAFWAHLLLSWLFYLYVFYLLEQNFVVYMHYRHRYMREQQLGGRFLSVMVRNIPERLCSDEDLLTFYRRLYPHNVVSATIAKDVSKLTSMIAERTSYYDSLDHAWVVYQNAISDATKNGETLTLEQQEALRPKHRLPKDLATGKLQTVDSINFYRTKVEELNVKIEHAQKEQYPALNSGFITFNSSYIVNTLSLVQTSIVPMELECRQAPHPRDVYWNGFYFGRRSRWIRGYVIMCAVYAMVFWWTIPTAFVGSLADISALAAGRPWLSWVEDIPTIIMSFIEGYLPAILLVVLMVLLPTILLKLSAQEGIEANTWLDQSMFTKYYIFQVFNFFLIVTISGTVTSALNQLIDSPTSIVTLLGNALPKTATFFATFILFSGLGGFPVQMLQIGNLIMSTIYKKKMCITEKEITMAEQPATPVYGAEYGRHLLMFVIGTTYATISPIVLPFTCIYFTLGYFVNKYKALYMYVPPIDGGGRHWPLVFGRMLVGCVIGQITLIGYFGIKEAPTQAALMIPLPILTYLYYNENMKAFGVKCEYLPVCDSVLVDAQRHAAERAKLGLSDDDDAGTTTPEFHPSGTKKNIMADDELTKITKTVTNVPLVGTALKGVGGLLSHGLKYGKNQLTNTITSTDIDLEEEQRKRELGILEQHLQVPDQQGYSDDESESGAIMTLDDDVDTNPTHVDHHSEDDPEEKITPGMRNRKLHSLASHSRVHHGSMMNGRNLNDPYTQMEFRVRRLNTDMESVYAQKAKREAKRKLKAQKAAAKAESDEKQQAHELPISSSHVLIDMADAKHQLGQATSSSSNIIFSPVAAHISTTTSPSATSSSHPSSPNVPHQRSPKHRSTSHRPTHARTASRVNPISDDTLEPTATATSQQLEHPSIVPQHQHQHSLDTLQRQGSAHPLQKPSHLIRDGSHDDVTPVVWHND